MRRLGPPPYVCLITKGNTSSANYASEKSGILGTICDAIADGVNMIQIREKALPARLVFDLARDVVKTIAGSDALVVVNDRADIALAAGADGVHLPEYSLTPQVVQRAFGQDLVIGVSTHSLESAISVADAGADYVLFGPVFPTPGKDRPAGVEALANVCAALSSRPVIAIGGVDEHNYSSLLDAGAAGVAAIRALNERGPRRRILNGLAGRPAR